MPSDLDLASSSVVYQRSSSGKKVPARLLQMGMSSKSLGSDCVLPSAPGVPRGSFDGTGALRQNVTEVGGQGLPGSVSTALMGLGATSSLPYPSAYASPFGAASLQASTSIEHYPSLVQPQLRILVSEVASNINRATSLPNLLLSNKLGKPSLSAQLGGSRSPAEARLEAHERAVNERIISNERCSLGSGSRLGSMPSLISTSSLEFRQAFLASLADLQGPEQVCFALKPRHNMLASD